MMANKNTSNLKLRRRKKQTTAMRPDLDDTAAAAEQEAPQLPLEKDRKLSIIGSHIRNEKKP